jgi:hypothetical protein
VNANCIWDRLAKFTAFCLFIAGLVAVCVWYLPLIHLNQHLR